MLVKWLKSTKSTQEQEAGLIDQVDTNEKPDKRLLFSLISSFYPFQLRRKPKFGCITGTNLKVTLVNKNNVLTEQRFYWGGGEFAQTSSALKANSKIL